MQFAAPLTLKTSLLAADCAMEENQSIRGAKRGRGSIRRLGQRRHLHRWRFGKRLLTVLLDGRTFALEIAEDFFTGIRFPMRSCDGKRAVTLYGLPPS